METGIKISSEVSKESAKNLKSLISTIFKVGKKTGMEQQTIREAMHLVSSSLKIENTSINNCTVEGDKNYS